MGSYALDEFLEEKIDIMKRWCDWLDRLEDGFAPRQDDAPGLEPGTR